MPRGNSKRPILIKFDPALVEEARRYTANLSAAVHEGLAWWVKLAKQQERAKAKPQAKSPSGDFMRDYIAF
jgi:hypothetical protein